MNRKLTIGILGSRGIPNLYGGYEEVAGELGARLVERGHAVSVYTAHNHPMKDKYWRGIRRILINNPETRLGTFGQFLYDLYCNLDSRKRNFDIVLHLGYTSDSLWYRFWPKKYIHLVNMDGMEWKRSKYKKPVQRFLRYAEKLATKRAKFLIADSIPIQDYLEGKYKVPVRFIAYGADIPKYFSEDVPKSFDLKPGGYDLIIARIEPENNIEKAIKAKIESGDKIPLVIIGNNNQFKKYLMDLYQHKSIIFFTDPIYDKKAIDSLRKYCRFYIHGHSVGGTNPSLLEAMACGCNIIAHSNPFNRSILQEDAFYFSAENELKKIFETPQTADFQKRKGNNFSKLKEQYNWETISDQHEKLFMEAVDNP
jgi:glycosyltransferase involved in cell wall biosynthesis